MASTWLLITGAIIAYSTFSILNGLRKNIAICRKANLPYIVVREFAPLPPPRARYVSSSSLTIAQAVSPFNRLFQLTQGFWMRIIHLLPRWMWEKWDLYVAFPPAFS
jgi:hypothetical protein